MKNSVRTSALETVSQIADDPDFSYLKTSKDIGGSCDTCGLLLASGEFVLTLAVACDVLGNWTIVLMDGGIRQYLKDEVA